jgi:hypothetical protein
VAGNVKLFFVSRKIFEAVRSERLWFHFEKTKSASPLLSAHAPPSRVRFFFAA